VAETVEGSALSLECVDHVHGGDSFSSGVLGVGDGISDDLLEEGSKDGSGVVVDERGDSLDTASSTESSDGGLGDPVNGRPGGLSGVSFSAGSSVLAHAFYGFFAHSSHFCDGVCVEVVSDLYSFESV
jgi:hypothetical protein